MTRPVRRDEAGFTLVELLVTMMLLSIVSVILFGFIDNVTETTTRATKDVQAETDAQLVLRRMSQDIRAAQNIGTTYPGLPTCPAAPNYASPSFAGYKSCISFSIYRPTSSTTLTCPRTDVVFGLVGTNLLMSRSEYTLSGGSCVVVPSKTQTAVVLMANVVNTASQPLFTYYDGLGNDMLALGTPKDPAGALTVRVTIAERYRKNSPTLLLTTTAALRNQR